MERKCALCGKTLEEGKGLELFDGSFVCEECGDEETLVCERCGNRFLNKIGIMYPTENGDVCGKCRERYAYVPCASCGNWHPCHEMTEVYRNGRSRVVCENCRDEDYSPCWFCGELHHHDDLISACDRDVCEDCFEEHFVVCDYCGSTVHRDYAQTINGNTICDSCLEYDYRICDECGDVVSSDDVCYDEDDNGLCPDCYNSRNTSRVIRDYHAGKFDVRFFTTENEQTDGTTPYVGFELEVDKGGEDNNNAAVVRDILGADRFRFEHDGSLDEGFEIISQPHTEAAHEEMREKYKQACKALLKMGYRSHDTSTCGLHVSISRASLGSYGEANMVFMYQRLFKDFYQLSRRKSIIECERWAKKYSNVNAEKGLSSPEAAYEEHCKAKNQCDRYTGINIVNNYHVELRFFKGTLKPETMYACIMFAFAFRKVCVGHSPEELKVMPRRKFWQEIAEYHPEVKAMIEKRLPWVYEKRSNSLPSEETEAC